MCLVVSCGISLLHPSSCLVLVLHTLPTPPGCSSINIKLKTNKCFALGDFSSDEMRIFCREQPIQFQYHEQTKAIENQAIQKQGENGASWTSRPFSLLALVWAALKRTIRKPSAFLSPLKEQRDHRAKYPCLDSQRLIGWWEQRRTFPGWLFTSPLLMTKWKGALMEMLLAFPHQSLQSRREAVTWTHPTGWEGRGEIGAKHSEKHTVCQLIQWPWKARWMILFCRF